MLVIRAVTEAIPIVVVLIVAIARIVGVIIPLAILKTCKEAGGIAVALAQTVGVNNTGAHLISILIAEYAACRGSDDDKIAIAKVPFVDQDVVGARLVYIDR